MKLNSISQPSWLTWRLNLQVILDNWVVTVEGFKGLGAFWSITRLFVNSLLSWNAKRNVMRLCESSLIELYVNIIHWHAYLYSDYPIVLIGNIYLRRPDDYWDNQYQSHTFVPDKRNCYPLRFPILWCEVVAQYITAGMITYDMSGDDI